MKSIINCRTVLLLLLSGIGFSVNTITSEAAENNFWPQFRGPKGKAIAATEASIPTQFGPDKNLHWRTELPPGHSSPVVWGNQIFLTAHQDSKLQMICLDRKNGSVLWTQSRPMGKERSYIHNDGGPANATPVADSNNVVFYFEDYGILVFDHEGNLKWENKSLTGFANEYSHGTSPILDQGRIFLNLDGGLKSSLVCLDVNNGDEIWRTPRPGRIMNFTTPHLYGSGCDQEILISGTGALTSYSTKDGTENWFVWGFPIFICPSPTTAGDIIIAGGWTTAHATEEESFDAMLEDPSLLPEEAKTDPAVIIQTFDTNKNDTLEVDEIPPGRMHDAFAFVDGNRDGHIDLKELIQVGPGKRNAPGKNTIMAIRPGGSGNVTGTHILWEINRGLPYVSSPLVYRDSVYLIKRGGLVTCVSLKDGSFHYRQERLGVGGEFYSSPVAVGDHILICAEQGNIFLIEASNDFKIVSETNLNDLVSATPAIVDNTLYVRSQHYLWAFSESSN